MRVVRVPESSSFLVIDLPDAPEATGVVRCARKILVDGATNLARLTTYTYALFGVRRSGASAGINAEADQRSAELERFFSGIADAAAPTRLALEAGKGLAEAEIPEALGVVALGGRPVVGDLDGLPLADRLLAAGALAALDGAGRPAADATFTVEWTPSAPALCEEITRLGGRIVAITGIPAPSGPIGVSRPEGLDPAGLRIALAPSTDEDPAKGSGPDATALAGLGEAVDPTAAAAIGCDVLAVGSRPGVVDHETMSRVQAATVLPIGPLAVTPRALAVARRADRTVVPDFLSLAAPHLARWPDVVGGAPSPSDLVTGAATLVRTTATSLIPGHDGLFLAACERAEDFLRTWQTETPFGRPLP